MTFDEQRARMVDLQLARRGISDARVLTAFRAVPRESFVPAALAELAYRDGPLPIGEDQTISQPYIVALTTQALGLEGEERVLDIGTGSGYAAAVLSRIAKEVFTVERLETLATEARERLERLGYHNVEVLHGDGTLGWPEHAPYDAIAVAAGAPELPTGLARTARAWRTPRHPGGSGRDLAGADAGDPGRGRRLSRGPARRGPLRPADRRAGLAERNAQRFSRCASASCAGARARRCSLGGETRATRRQLASEFAQRRDETLVRPVHEHAR